VVPRDELMPSVLKFAREITAKSPAVIKAFLELTSMDNQQSLSDQFEKESQLFSQLWVARDFQDWLKEFLGKSGE
jgi:enoyl-CoA hydratase/carnithine racemase